MGQVVRRWLFTRQLHIGREDVEPGRPEVGTSQRAPFEIQPECRDLHCPGIDVDPVQVVAQDQVRDIFRIFRTLCRIELGEEIERPQQEVSTATGRIEQADLPYRLRLSGDRWVVCRWGDVVGPLLWQVTIGAHLNPISTDGILQQVVDHVALGIETGDGSEIFGVLDLALAGVDGVLLGIVVVLIDPAEDLIDRFGAEAIPPHIDALLVYAEEITRSTIVSIPDGTYSFTDYLDDDGIGEDCIVIKVAVTIDGSELSVDFTGTDPEVRGSVNAVASVVKSAVYYVVRCLLPPEAPFNEGTFGPVTVIAPEGSVINAYPPSPVSGGNVETSQRITDVVFGALAAALPDKIPAASQGTMNNITAGGVDPRNGEPFAYYETMGGGIGVRPGLDGLSGVHVHMSNTLNTPIEAFEYEYPMRITEYRIREGSGGFGAATGGDGLVREIEFQVPTQVTLLTERRKIGPYGLQGGHPGARGENLLIRAGEELPLAGKVKFDAAPGDRLSIRSPGGGGWGTPDVSQ
jgi:hypothetical protein